MTVTLGTHDAAPSPEADVPALLRRCRETVTPALQQAVDRLDPASREQAAYHLGWTELDGTPGRGGGKAVRPALALLSAEAAGASVAAGIAGGVAVELVHNFSLLHDDLIDGDAERRHRPTVWARWGAASAILCGDVLLALATEVLLEDSSPHAAEAARQLAATTRELVRGQVADVAFERRGDVGVDECLDMASGKTASLLATSASIGAVLAGAPEATTSALRTFGHAVGMAFQLVDDLLGIWGDPAVTGKPALSDLRSRKKSLPVTWAVCHGGQAGRELAAWLTAPDQHGEPDEAELVHAAKLVEQAGGRQWATAQAIYQQQLGERALGAAPLAERPCRELLALGHHLLDRKA